MADLNELQAANTVKIAGSDASGNESNFVQATANNALHINIRDVSGAEVLVATLAEQQTQSSYLTSIYSNTANIPTVGQKLKAVSLPVVIASDQTVPISAVSLPLPSGAATATLQTTINSSIGLTNSALTDITNNTLRDGQHTMADSIPVVIASNQTAIPVTQSTIPWTVSGTVTAANGSVSNTAAAVPSQATMVGGSDGTNLRAVKVSTAGVVSVDGSAVTQPISIAATVAVSGPLTDTQLRATAVPVSGTVTANLGTIAGVATETTLSALSAKFNSLGQKTMANSAPVVISSDQSAIPITGSITAASGLGNNPTYISNTSTITGATATGTKSLAYIWHPSAVTKRYKLVSIIVDQTAGNGSGGSQRIELNRITAENATPGGTTGTIVQADGADSASGATIRIAPTGAPTRASGTYFSCNLDPKVNAQVMPIGYGATETLETKPLAARTSTAEGYEIVQVVSTTLSTAPVYNITWTWVEV